jgi:ribosomal protein S18 acetylase RimI-like enzyme
MIIVRKATPDDSESIAACLFLAMEDIICKFIGEEDPGKASDFMLYFVRKGGNQYSYQNCWVAEENLKVVAAVNIYNGALLRELRQPVIEYLRTEFNRDFDHEDETQAGEFYLDTLGVHPGHQGKGVGTMLLQFLIDEFVSKNRQTLGLLVDETNLNAKRLYLKLGFECVGKRILFGKRMEHFQLKV